MHPRVQTFLPRWKVAIYGRLLYGKSIKGLAVNVKDLEKYEECLAALSPDGVIPTEGGVLRYKRIPLGISDDLKPGECAVIE